MGKNAILLKISNMCRCVSCPCMMKVDNPLVFWVAHLERNSCVLQGMWYCPYFTNNFLTCSSYY